MQADLTEGAGSGLPASFFPGLHFFGTFKELSERRDYQSDDVPEALCLSNPVCGDVVGVQVYLKADRISEYRFRARGCWPVFGCLQWLGDHFVGREVSEALTFSLEDFLGVIEEVPASKRHAFSLTHRVFRRAVAQAMMVPS